LRNVFDQYAQPENRVTHALITALDQDRSLLGHFLRELVKVTPPTNPRRLSILEQQYPGEEEPSEEELERRGIPDVAAIEFDLRTAVSTAGPVVKQPRWLSAAYGSFVDKRGSNYEIATGVIFRYDRCPELRREDAISLVAASWLACKPLIDLAR
jgi:hypothetical protein